MADGPNCRSIRVDRPIAKAEPTGAELTANHVLAAEYVGEDCLAMLEVMAKQLELTPTNRLADVSSTFPGVAGQAYTHGLIELGDDDVWVAECRIPPECSYWSVQLVDYAYSALDAMYTQASLNGHSAVADPDGVFRIVVCADDPGLANWLDTGGQQRVQIRFRWYAPMHRRSPRAWSAAGIWTRRYRTRLASARPSARPHSSSGAIGLQWRRRW